jgi:hypothetical protein
MTLVIVAVHQMWTDSYRIHPDVLTSLCYVRQHRKGDKHLTQPYEIVVEREVEQSRSHKLQNYIDARSRGTLCITRNLSDD